MSSPGGIERRDPASGLLRLGRVLTEARQRRQSGSVRVEDQGHQYTIRLKGGRISEVAVDGRIIGSDAARGVGIQRCAEQLFVLPRPHVQFENLDMKEALRGVLDSEKVILGGVRRRPDLFDPILLVERIPVNAVSLSRRMRDRLHCFSIDLEERAFIKSLEVPTPVPMILWKRGLDPKRAATLLMALNLLGAFENWDPGDLPRLGAAAGIRRQAEATSDDYALLGIDADATSKEVDRAFRRLSFSLHPDRMAGLGEADATQAREAFTKITAAHARLRGSRRSRKHRSSTFATVEIASVRSATAPWMPLLEEARRAAAQGDGLHARRLAIKAIALSPPKPVVEALKQLLKSVA